MTNNELQQIVVKIIIFFNQTKIITNKQFASNQSPYSEDEDYLNDKQQHYNNRRNNNWITDQPDSFYQPDIF